MIYPESINIRILPNGNLRLTADNALRKAMREARDDGRCERDIWNDIWERHWTNGGPYPVDPDSYFFGLTGDPYMICAEFTDFLAGEPIPDHDKEEEDWPLAPYDCCVCYGKKWHNPNWMLDDVVGILIKKGSYTLALWDDTGNTADLRSATWTQAGSDASYDAYVNCLDRKNEGRAVA
jgi:hypothetical protein